MLVLIGAFYWLDRQKELFTYDSEEGVREGVDDNIQLTVGSFKAVWKKVWWLILSLGGVYYLEYTITTGFTQGTTY